jgi:hypothetical protein
METEPVRRVLERLPGARRVGSSWQARCPAHDDRAPSLSISLGKNGAALLRCHAGCSMESIVSKLGLTVRDLFPPRESQSRESQSRESQAGGKKILAIYDYLNYAGELLYQVVRFEPKDFRQRRPDGKGGWIWNMQGVQRVLYRLIELRESGPDEWVFIVEGEKDADRLAAQGLVATCNVGGAGKWREEYSQALRDRRVCIIPDNDEPGREHARQVAASLHGIAGELRILNEL